MNLASESIRIVPFDAALSRSFFRSGNTEIDLWFQLQAGQAQRKNHSRTYLAIASGEIRGFYSLGVFESDQSEPPWECYPVRGILIQRLGVDSTFQGRGLGKKLLQDALIRSSKALEIVGGSVIAVDAKTGARDFYLKFGFQEVSQDSKRLYLKLSHLNKILASVQTTYIQKRNSDSED